jgi:hypothetical protein
MAESFFLTILEQLRQIAGMTEQEFYSIINQPVLQLPQQEQVEVTNVDSSDVDSSNKDSSNGSRLTLLTNQMQSDVDSSNGDTLNEGNLGQTYVGIPEQVKVENRIREDYPFLAEPGCPDELKIAVADMITAWYQAKAGHEALFQAENPEQELQAVTVVVESMLANTELRDKLNFYKVHGTLQSEEEAPEVAKMKEAVDAMTAEQRFLRRQNVILYITRKNKELEPKDGKPAPNEKKVESLKKQIASYQLELEYLNSLMAE